MQGHERFAVYYLPHGALGRAGSDWLGWDVRRGEARAPAPVRGLDLEALTAAPRRYGFHATMRAPFRPRPGIGTAELSALLAEICAEATPITLEGGLRLVHMAGFIALVPQAQGAALHALEARLVRATNPLRAPLTQAEVLRRRPARLDAAQRLNLARWGYPFVGEQFRFHLTLSGPVDAATAARAMAALRERLPPLPVPCRIDSLSLMGEGRNGRFRELARLPLRDGDGRALPG